MTSLSFFCASFLSGIPLAWPYEKYSQGALEILISKGLAVETKPSRHADCFHCGRQFVVQQDQKLGPHLGCEDKTPILPEATRRWRPLIAALPPLLYKHLSLDGCVEELINGKLWLLGRLPSRNGGFPVWLLLSRNEPDCFQSAISTLQARSPAECGIILATSRNALSTRWPRDSQAVMLSDILHLSNGELSVDRSLLNDRAPRSKQTASQPGRPTKNETDAKAIFHHRVLSGDAIKDSCAAEARAIAALEEQDYGSENARSWRSISNTIGPLYAEWVASGQMKETLASQNQE